MKLAIGVISWEMCVKKTDRYSVNNLIFSDLKEVCRMGAEVIKN